LMNTDSAKEAANLVAAISSKTTFRRRGGRQAIY
jgi:hypothetical protein